MAYHHAQQVYFDHQKYSPSNNGFISKFNGSYIQQPLIDQTLSSSNQKKRHVLKSKTIALNQQQQGIRSYKGLPCTMKIYNMNQVSQQTKKILRRQYRIYIKQYLKRKYNKPTYLLPIQAFQALRKITFNPKDNQYLFKTNVMYFYKPFYFLQNIKYVLDTQRKVVSADCLAHLCRSVIGCCLKYGGLDNFLMTSSNIYFQDNFEDLTINYTSFVGLGLINCKQEHEQIQIQQYFQIYPHLSRQIMQKGIEINSTKNNLKVAKYSKIRSCLINILCLFLRRDIYFDPRKIKSKTIQRKDALQDVKELRSLFQHLIKTEINSVKLLKVYKYFIPSIRSDYIQKYQQFHEKNKKKQFKHKTRELAKQQAQWNTHRSQYLRNILQKILCKQDTQIKWESIIDCFSDYSSSKTDQQLNTAFEQLHEIVWQKQENKQFYKDRGIAGSKLYIPIKMNGQIQLMLAHSHWWYIFLQQEYNFLHEPFCYKILKVLLDKHQENGSDIRKNKVYQTVTKYMEKAQFSKELNHYSQQLKEKHIQSKIKK